MINFRRKYFCHKNLFWSTVSASLMQKETQMERIKVFVNGHNTKKLRALCQKRKLFMIEVKEEFSFRKVESIV